MRRCFAWQGQQGRICHHWQFRIYMPHAPSAPPCSTTSGDSGSLPSQAVDAQFRLVACYHHNMPEDHHIRVRTCIGQRRGGCNMGGPGPCASGVFCKNKRGEACSGPWARRHHGGGELEIQVKQVSWSRGSGWRVIIGIVVEGYKATLTIIVVFAPSPTARASSPPAYPVMQTDPSSNTQHRMTKECLCRCSENANQHCNTYILGTISCPVPLNTLAYQPPFPLLHEARPSHVAVVGWADKSCPCQTFSGY